MKGYYSDTKPTGDPVTVGLLCWISDYTDEGLGKVATYGHTELEITEKLARQNAHAQMVIAQQRATPPPAAAPAPAPTPAVRGRVPLTADQRIKLTADLDNPATAGRAVVELLEDTTGLSVQDLQQDKFNRMFQEWLGAHPDFPRGVRMNVRLLLLEAERRAGSHTKITPQTLDAVFQQLQSGGELLAEMPVEDEPSDPASPQPSATRAGESQPPPSTRPRVVATTTHRTTRMASAAAPQFKPKYTREQIDGMSAAENRRLIDDPDYNASVEYYYPSSASRARA
jgi:hypothetical protein